MTQNAGWARTSPGRRATSGFLANSILGILAYSMLLGLLGSSFGPAATVVLAAPAGFDEGSFDPAWFGSGQEFRSAKSVDYLWAASGLAFEGKTLHFETWPKPNFIGENSAKRDPKDRQLAAEIAAELPELLSIELGNALGAGVKTSLTEGDILVTGRIVDCEKGSKATRFLTPGMAGKGKIRLDLKVTDKASGQLLLALHHKIVSATALSSTWSEVVKWVGQFAAEVQEKGFARMYQEGKPAGE